MRVWLALPIVLLLTSSAFAQKGIRWNNDAGEAFKVARQRDVPVLAYIKGSSGNDDDVEDVERDQQRSFNDPRIARLASRFVCVRMSATRHKEAIEKWRLPERINLVVVFSTPSGDLIGQSSSAQVAVPESFGEAISAAWRQYAEQRFKEKLEPILASPDSNPKQLIDALKDVREGVVVSADSAVRSVLQREGLDPRARLEALKALAEFSTKPAMDDLLTLAAGGDKDALKALHDATPEGAEHLFDALGASDDPSRLKTAYAAIVKICKIQNPKPDRYWDGPNAADQQKEIERVKEAATKVAERWKKNEAPYR